MRNSKQYPFTLADSEFDDARFREVNEQTASERFGKFISERQFLSWQRQRHEHNDLQRICGAN